MLREFRDFAVKGNVIDLAIAIILGAAFGKVVSSLVDNVLRPPLGLLLGHVDLANLFWNLSGTLARHWQKSKRPVFLSSRTAYSSTISSVLFWWRWRFLCSSNSPAVSKGKKLPPAKIARNAAHPFHWPPSVAPIAPVNWRSSYVRSRAVRRVIF